MSVAVAEQTAAASIRDQLAFLGFADSDVIELQALKCETVYGAKHTASAFVRVDGAAPLVARATQCQGVYLVANGVRPEVALRRSPGAWHRLSGDATTDADIAARRVLAIDCDPVTPVSGISAADAERACARRLADAVRGHLLALDVPEDAIGEVDSGNGYQVWIALDTLATGDQTDALVRQILSGIAARVHVDGAKIDTSIHDRKRLLPVAGTAKRKGTNSPERPHRLVSFAGPASPHRLGLDDLRVLADRLAPVEAARTAPPPMTLGTIFDRANVRDMSEVAGLLGLDVDGKAVECPGCRRKSGTMAAILDSTSKPGTQVIKCQSATCSPHRDGTYTPIDAVAAVRGLTPIEAAQWLTEESKPNGTILGSLSSRVARLGSAGPRLRTGFPTFDAACRGGLPMQRVIVVGGAPGAAKTSTVAQWALRWAREGIPVAFLAADEEADGILVRWGQQCGHDLDDLEAGKPSVRVALDRQLASLPLYLVDSEDSDDPVTIERVSSELRARRGEGPASVLIVDSIQMAGASGTEKVDSPRERIDAVVRALKRAAKRDGHLVIATSELARGAYRDENTINPLAAFKESGSIEYGVGTALVLRTVDGEPGIIDVSVPKNRIGRSADAKRPFRLRLDFDRARLSEIDLPPRLGADPGSRSEALEAAIFAAVDADTLFTPSAVYAALQDRGQRIRKATVIDRVKALVADGALVGGGKSPLRVNRIPVPDVDRSRVPHPH